MRGAYKEQAGLACASLGFERCVAFLPRRRASVAHDGADELEQGVPQARDAKDIPAAEGGARGCEGEVRLRARARVKRELGHGSKRELGHGLKRELDLG